MSSPSLNSPTRIQRRRTAGWKMPPNTVYVGRGSKWGNPYRIGQDGAAEQVVERFRQDIEGRLALGSGRELAAAIAGLRGRNLACWCPEGGACHADVLLKLANAPEAADAF